jgi:hypothetical protein
MNKIIYGLAVLFVLMVLIAIALAPKLKSGIVVEKYIGQPQVIVVDNSPVYSGPSYHIIVKGEYEGRELTEDRIVFLSTYSRLNVGDHWDIAVTD